MSPVARLTGWTPVHVSWAGRHGEPRASGASGESGEPRAAGASGASGAFGASGASGDEPTVEWRDLRGIAFGEPFFGDTVDRAVREPYRLLFAARTPIDELGVVAGEGDRARPSGFVFHASRCGSTLVSNMLGALDATIVASEPPVLDGILRADVMAGVDDETRRRWLGWAIDCLGQLGGGERRVFVKFDAWSTRDIGLVRSVYPDVPCVFVYRDPAEIIASQMRMRGAHMVPGMLPAELFGLDPETVGMLPPEEYCARVLARVLGAAGDHVAGGLAGDHLAGEAADDRVAGAAAADHMPGEQSVRRGCRLVHYGELPDLVADELLGHFGVDASGDELARVELAAGVDAKNPLLAFDPTGPGGARPITPAIRASSDRWAAASYARLEAARLEAGRTRDGDMVA
jgi:hypothetical protein